MARTKKVDVSNSGEFKHRSYVSENGETLYDAPIEIKDKADMNHYGITIEDCKYLHLGSSQRILVYFYKTTNRAFAEAQWEYITCTPGDTTAPDAWCPDSARPLSDARIPTSARNALMVGHRKQSRHRSSPWTAWSRTDMSRRLPIQ